MNDNKITLTIDIDWVADDVIEYVAEILLKYNIKATWFVTHKSPAIKTLFKRKDLFKTGIHPNFLPNSTQGRTMREIMDYLLDICPGAQIMRTHGLYQSSLMFAFIIENYPQIKIDASLFIPAAKNLHVHKFYAQPSYPERFIYRIPFLWEDDFTMISAHPNFKFKVNNFPGYGVKVFNFHPIHIALNSSSWIKYTNLKRRYSTEKIKLKDLLKLRENNKKGTEDFLREMLNNKNIQFIHLKEWVSRCR